MLTTDTCVHHFLIDNATMLGTCRRCGYVRQFERPWLPSASAERSARGKRGAQKRIENKAKAEEDAQ